MHHPRMKRNCCSQQPCSKYSQSFLFSDSQKFLVVISTWWVAICVWSGYLCLGGRFYKVVAAEDGHTRYERRHRKNRILDSWQGTLHGKRWSRWTPSDILVKGAIWWLPLSPARSPTRYSRSLKFDVRSVKEIISGVVTTCSIQPFFFLTHVPPFFFHYNVICHERHKNGTQLTHTTQEKKGWPIN